MAGTAREDSAELVSSATGIDEGGKTLGQPHVNITPDFWKRGGKVSISILDRRDPPASEEIVVTVSTSEGKELGRFVADGSQEFGNLVLPDEAIDELVGAGALTLVYSSSDSALQPIPQPGPEHQPPGTVAILVHSSEAVSIVSHMTAPSSRTGESPRTEIDNS